MLIPNFQIKPLSLEEKVKREKRLFDARLKALILLGLTMEARS
jgi:hypothetical protein